MRGVRIGSAAEIGGAARLEGAWLAAFGPGDRPEGWFARKLVRECVDDELSQVAIAIGEDPRSPRSWRGFVLAGRPPSLAGAVRTAGTAVLPGARGQGIGRALLDAVCDAAGRAGATAVELVADARAILYYERLGFVRVRDAITVRIDGEGESRRLSSHLPPDLGGPVAWEAAAEGLRSPVELAAWTPEAWAGSSDRHTVDVNVDIGLARALASREGQAWLVHRWLAEDHVRSRRAGLALARTLHGPIVIPHVHPHRVSSITEAGAAAVAQRGALLVLELSQR